MFKRGGGMSCLTIDNNAIKKPQWTPKKWKIFIEIFPKLSLMFLALIGGGVGSSLLSRSKASNKEYFENYPL